MIADGLATTKERCASNNVRINMAKKHRPKNQIAPENAVEPAPTPQRPALDIESLRNFLDNIRSFAGPALILESSSVNRLYHYTDLPGLNGIVSNNDLWLTHLRFSNDDEEMTHGQNIVAELLKERPKKPERGQLSYLERLEEILDEPVTDGVYVCCFCARDNLLSQWRGYAANGTGVSIELNHQAFDFLTGPDCMKHGLLRLWKVFYKEEQQREIVAKAIEFAWKHQQDLTIEKRAQNAADAIQFFIPTFKNRDFEEENEWRLIFTPQPNAAVQPQFRTARNMLVPYYSLQKLGWGPTQPLPIKGLCIGPSTHKALNAQSAQLLLKQRNYTNVPVSVSKIPFRG
ncbi:MAG: DUF2971 domain-containing protein [Planctomycetaceae bacterium]|nr:DUF2971 domain-containing protein [Planctomycetaceae bacterium]